MMTLQQIFDRIATHLLTQKAKAIHNGMCRYRDADGLKCAVGSLITEACYNPSLENLNVWSQPIRAALLCSGVFDQMPDYAEPAIGLLRLLQSTHDDLEVSQWRENLSLLAQAKGFDPAVLNNFPA